MNNLDRYKKDLESLILKSDRLYLGLILDAAEESELDEILKELKKQKKLKKDDKVDELVGDFRKEYQRWYTESSSVVKLIIPERHDEFVSYYRIDPKRKSVGSETYRIQDWMNGFTSSFNHFEGKKYFQDSSIVCSYFQSQREILKSCQARFESSLLDISQVLQADIFDSELEAAHELWKKGFLRASGAMCGVILEKHLQQVAQNHGITIRKKHPTIADLNDPLKNQGVYDVPVWRNIQRLADVRNLCDHNKDREPQKDEVLELVEGVEKFTKTIY